MSFIQVENATKAYGDGQMKTTALAGVSFQVEVGEFVAIMGPSGSGKSTLLSLLGGMNPPSTGSITVDDTNIYALSTERLADFRRCYLGFVFQQSQLLPYLTALENVALPLLATEMESDLEAAEAALCRVGLGDKLGRLPGELSGGEQCRVAIARALVTNPPLLLADEPTGSLDSRTGGEILAILQQLNDAGQTIIMVTHNPDAAATATRVITLADGNIEDDSRQFRAQRPGNISVFRPVDGGASILQDTRAEFANSSSGTVSVLQALFTVAIVSQILLAIFLVFQNITSGPGH